MIPSSAATPVRAVRMVDPSQPPVLFSGSLSTCSCWVRAAVSASATGVRTTMRLVRRRAGLAAPTAMFISCVTAMATSSAPASRRPSSADHRLAPALPAARGLLPTRPPRCVMRPGWGRKEEVRRLAGPGLGGAAVVRTTTWTVGRSPPRQADPLSTTVGGSWGWSAMRWAPRGPPDRRPHPPSLSLRLIIIAGIRRREESLPSAPTLLSSIGITPEEEARGRGWGGVVGRWMTELVTA